MTTHDAAAIVLWLVALLMMGFHINASLFAMASKDRESNRYHNIMALLFFMLTFVGTR